MLESTCPQCKNVLSKPSNRLVQDACGHKKCRSCLLADEEGCKQCTLKNGQFLEPSSKNENQSTVIQCNGRPLVKLTDKSKDSKCVNFEQDFKVPKKTDKQTKLDIPKHIVQKTDPPSFRCTVCGKSFRTKAHVKYHKYCAGGELKPYKCDSCGKDFVLKSQLDLHTLKHREAKPFECEVCRKSFTEKSKLNRHSALHSPEKRHLCTECGKRFKSKESLKIHLTIHRGDKDYVCKLCPAKFNNSSNLKRHLVTHSKEKVHMCDQCGKRFKLKWALLVHRRSHLRVRPFECDVCGKTFVNNKDLQRHGLVHIESAGFMCSVCRMTFRRRDNLHRHMKNTHPDKKGEIIKREVKAVQKSVVVDNPNAIHVITASPAVAKSKAESVAAEPSLKSVDSRRVGSVINGPIKLAFKTPAFKSHYNITRDCDYVPPPPINLAESVDICQKILSPSTDFCAHGMRTIDERTSTEICQKILSMSGDRIADQGENLHYATSFQNRTHAMIKNIKFKVPARYTDLFKSNKESERVAATSVIVNNNGSDVHWRRRTSQNLTGKF